MTEIIQYIPWIGNLLGIGTDVTDEIPHTPHRLRRVAMIILKLAAEVCEITYETLVLSNKVIPFIQRDNNTVNKQFNENQYGRGCHAYIAFYVVGLLGVIAYWVHHWWRGNHPKYGALVLGITTEMPLMMAEMVMLKAGTKINWDNEKNDLMLQMFFLLNLFVGTSIDLLKWVAHMRQEKGSRTLLTMRRLLFITLFVLMICCMVYAPVTWVYAGFHLTKVPKAKDFDSPIICANCAISFNFVDDGESAMDFLLRVGFLGNWLIIVTCALVVVVGPCLRFRLQRRRRHNSEKNGAEEMQPIHEESQAPSPSVDRVCPYVIDDVTTLHAPVYQPNSPSTPMQVHPRVKV